MAYTKTVWEDLPSTNTPLSATNLNKIENELEKLDNNSLRLACTDLGSKTSTFDLNDLQLGESCYWSTGSNIPTNSPADGARAYCFEGYGNAYQKVQICFVYNSNDIYVRTWFNNAWTNWSKNVTEVSSITIPAWQGIFVCHTDSNYVYISIPRGNLKKGTISLNNKSFEFLKTDGTSKTITFTQLSSASVYDAEIVLRFSVSELSFSSPRFVIFTQDTTITST